MNNKTFLSTKLFADVDALKCDVCTETGDDACSKSKLAGDQATYSRDCGDFLDRCFRQEAKVLGLKTVSTFCATEISGAPNEDIVQNHLT